MVYRQKAQTVCRLLYHLREGPLLDGPAADPMEAYLLRSLFLKSDYQQTLRIVMPSLQLAVNMNAHVSDFLLFSFLFA